MRLSKFIFYPILFIFLVSSFGFSNHQLPMPTIEEYINSMKAGDVLRITRSIKLYEKRDLVLDANGGTIEYVGEADTEGIIELGSCLNCVIRNIRIIDRSGAKSAVLISNLPNKVGSTGCIIDNVFIRYANGEPGPKCAFKVDHSALGGADVNNDLHTFRDCSSNNHSEAGVYIKGTQAHRIIIDRCNFADYGERRPIGVLAERSGYFTIRDSSFWKNSIDVKVGGPTEKIHLSGINSEHSNQFIISDKVGAPAKYIIEGFRWDGEPLANTPVMDLFGDGQFSIRDGSLRGLNGINPFIKCHHYFGNDGFSLPGSVDISGLWVFNHSEDESGIDLIVPRKWSLRCFGSKHATINSGIWPRRKLNIQRIN